MSKSIIKIWVVPSRSGKTWSVRINGWRVLRHTAQPLADAASRLMAAGHKPHRQIIMTRMLGAPCRCASTLAAAAAAESGEPFNAPDWTTLHSNGCHQ